MVKGNTVHHDREGMVYGVLPMMVESGGMALYIFMTRNQRALAGSRASLEPLNLTSTPMTLHLPAKPHVQKFPQPSTSWGPSI